MANIKYTKEILEPIIARSTSWASVCRELGVKPFTGAQSHIRKVAKKYEIDSSHFHGHGWNKGQTARNAKHIDEYLVQNSTIHSGKLRIKLFKAGYKEEKCESCNLQEWNGNQIPLELHHINNDHWDNRIENLEILCPNCHAQK